jgi:hypothetical protein
MDSGSIYIQLVYKVKHAVQFGASMALSRLVYKGSKVCVSE